MRKPSRTVRKITDDEKEIFDLVDQDDQVIGQATRGECHRDKSLVHRCIGILVFNDQGMLFLQKRSLSKDLQPGLWALSVGGHPKSGQTYKEGAKKEMKEELGIEAPIEKITKYCYQGETETEMFVVYKTVHNGPFTLHPEEIEKGQFFSLEDLAGKVKSGEISLSPAAEYALRFLNLLK
ncbi:MAG TPA: NUDIX domain-containing protein [Candidatus Bathyarchaeia archaeon]|nr:NUDIX domain-containing protein [Candidatus Bathyarchaeia archaeon]